MTKLWNLYPDNLEACKAKDRDFLPSLDTYFAEAIEQVENPTTRTEDNLLRDGNFGWRALRLMARRSPHFFTYSNNPINKLPDYLEMMVKKIAADRPGRIQENSDQNDAELEENLFKQVEANEEIKQTECDEDYIQFKVTILTSNQFEQFYEKSASNWKKLASKLGYQSDEIDFFATQNSSDVSAAKDMLHVWFEDDDDSTLENFSYILEGLEMMEAAEAVKIAIEQNKNINLS